MINLLFLLGDVLKEGFIGIILTLDTLIYGLISSAFRVFMAIASARLLSSEAYYAIANKVYLVVGVLMLFVLSYGILKAIVNPDEGTKQMGPGLLKKIAIAVIGLAVTPAIFNLMYQAQGLVLEHDVLAKLFFRSENTEKIQTSGSLTFGNTSVPVDEEINPDDFVKTVGGSYTATTIWQAFFYPAPDSGLGADEITADPMDYYLDAAGWGLGCGGVIAGTVAGVTALAVSNIWNPVGWVLGIGAVAATVVCTVAATKADAAETASSITDGEISLEEAYALTAAGESFGLYTIFLDNYIDDGEIAYLFGISTLCGAFALYAFASFSIDMGVRAAKLAYFQVIAPIPLVMQILPGKDGVFKDYTKKVVHTFLEVFIRISVVYIVIYLICHLSELFSSADALWGNNELSTPELMFAMAFLIIGLIIFCKEAPKFFGETLGINSGNMSLGLRKKLADGGVYNAAGVGYGGITSAVRNWRNYKNGRGESPWYGRLGSAIAGLGSGAARAAKSQLIGPDKHPSMNWRDAKNAGERAAQAATDKREERAQRRVEVESAQQQARDAERELATAIRNGDTVAEAAARQKLEDARRRFMHATAVGATADNLYKKLDSWSAGSVSLEQEEADIKFSNGLKKLRDEAREEAYKKDLRTQAYKKKMEELQAKEITEYREGWDEQSYNEAVRRRNEEKTEARISTDANVIAQTAAKTAAEAALTAAQNQLALAQASGNAAAIAAAQTDLATAQTNLGAAQTSLDAAKAAARAAISAADLAADRDAAIQEISATAKKDAAEMDRERFELQREIKITKDLMEASADEWVSGQIGVKGSDVARIYQEFLNNNQDYISNNGSRSILEGSNVTVSQMIQEFTADGRNVKDVTVTGQADVANSNFIFSPNANDPATGRPLPNITYTRNNHGTYDASDGSLTGVSLEDLFVEMTAKLKATGNKAEFKADTASTATSGKGKKAAEGIPVSESYRDKVRRKRQAEEARSGKK